MATIDRIEALDQLTEEEIKEIFGSFEADDLMGLLQAARGIQDALEEDGPQDDDQLWFWVKKNLGLEIPRVAVCEGHQSPFEFLAACYFNRHPAILGMGNRGGGKTFMVALLHWLNSEFRPGIESATFGATEAQSLRCYAHLKNWINDDDGQRKPQIKSSVMRETNWRPREGMPGSKVEVLPGTPEGVNGPHPQIAHGDEVELMREDTWKESRNMAVSKQGPKGKTYPSLEVLTSTRKGLQGRMQKLIDGIQEAVKVGAIPDYFLIIWCIFEIAQEVPNCQEAPEDKRRKRLEKLGLDPSSLCECHRHMKGKWPKVSKNIPEKPRYLNEVCNGRLFRSRGFMPYADVVQKFKQNDKGTWEAQQECSKPETEFNYLQGYDQEKHCIRNFIPDPENGPIFQSVDWGGTNPHAVNWYQEVLYEIDVLDFNHEKMRIPAGSLVVVDEIYIAEIGVTRLAKMVKKKEMEWRVIDPHFEIEDRFADPQGKAARKDFKDEGLVTHWHGVTRDFDTQVEWVLRDYWEDGKIYCCIDNAPMWNEEAQSWQKDPKNPDKQLDEFNHCMSNFRYAVANIRALRRRKGQGKTPPKANRGRHRSVQRVEDTRRTMTGPIGVTGGEQDRWRASLGGPDPSMTGGR